MSQSDPTNVGVFDDEGFLGAVAVSSTAAVEAVDAGDGEPTQVRQGETAIAASLPEQPALPSAAVIPIPIRTVSGRYRGTWGSFQLELRVDVDRTRPMKRLSGDFFQISGGTTTYFGSFVVNSVSIT